MKKVSQLEIALEAGVSQALVSMVLNGKREGVAEESYRRIWDCAERHGYRRRGREKKLDGNSIQTVGYVLRSPLRLASTSNFFSEVLEGLDGYLAGNLSRTSFLGSEDDLPSRSLHEIVSRDPGFRGIVIMGEIKEESMDLLLSLQCPLVYISARAPGVCHSVNANETAAAELAVNHLAALGHKTFAYLGAEVPQSRCAERRSAFLSALRRNPSDGKLVAEVTCKQADRSEGWELSEQLLALPKTQQATAWVCVGGVVARGAMDALRRIGGRAGTRISILSLDSTQICQKETPTITSTGTDPQLLGKEAGKLLTGLTHNEKVMRDLALPAKLIQGDSTRP